MMIVPFFDLTKQYQSIKQEINFAISDVLEKQQFILGPVVDAFEENIANYCHANYSIGVSSGTDALLLALMAIDIKPGDEVITSPFTFIATINCILRLGAKPVFVDINSEDFTIDTSIIESKITKKTKAIIPIHLFGQMAKMDIIRDIAENSGFFIIEDAAQSIGAKYKNIEAGTWGDLGCFSFFPTKNLGGYGDGGMIITKDPSLYEKIKRIRSQGQRTKYYSELVGGNFRLDTLQAAIINVKLKHLDAWINHRRANAYRYNNMLKDLSDKEKMALPIEGENNFHTFNQYVIRVPNYRDKLMKFLNNKNIGSEIYYPFPAHLQPLCSHLKYKLGCFPESEKAAQQSLALPIFPELTEAMQEIVSATIHEFFKQNS